MSNAKTQIKRRAWPKKRRQEQAENCKKSKPWTHTTGPKTTEGKNKTSQNALKHGTRSQEFIELRRVIKEQLNFIKGLEKKRKTP